MKNITLSILVSILFHIGFLGYIGSYGKKEITPPQDQPYKPTSIKYVKLTTKKPSTDEKIQVVPPKQEKLLTPPTPIPVQTKKQNPKNIEIPTKKEIPPKPQEYVEVTQPLQTPLEKALAQEEQRPIDDLTQSYLELYGEDFYGFSETTKEYLKDNLSQIGKITQKYLLYPSISIRTKQQGYNVVEFYLHPNGDITDLKLIQSSSYSALDNNSIHTIKIAYKDYPKPTESTKIRIFVYYKLH